MLRHCASVSALLRMVWLCCCAAAVVEHGLQYVLLLQPKTVTTNWKDLDDIVGGRATGLDGVGAATAPNVRSGP